MGRIIAHERTGVVSGLGLENLKFQLSGSNDPVYINPSANFRSWKPRLTIWSLISLIVLAAFGFEVSLCVLADRRLRQPRQEPCDAPGISQFVALRV
jgi:hypothetical protein